MQYGIRMSQEDISYSEWSRLIIGIMPETPLGSVIGVRAEKDRDIISKFGTYERKIRNDWQEFKTKKFKKSNLATKQDLENLRNMLKTMFSKKK